MTHPRTMPAKSRISRSKWPWGRVSPSQRIRDLGVMIARNKAQIPIVEDQAREAIRRIEMNIKALEDQLQTARDCETEAVRAENKEIAYELSLFGVQVIERVNETEDQTGLREELIELLAAAKAKREANEGEEDDLDGFFT